MYYLFSFCYNFYHCLTSDLFLPSKYGHDMLKTYDTYFKMLQKCNHLPNSQCDIRCDYISSLYIRDSRYQKYSIIVLSKNSKLKICFLKINTKCKIK